MNHTWQVVTSIPYVPEFSFPCIISISDLKPFCLFSAISEYHLFFFRALYECHLQQLVHAKELNRTSWYCPQMEAAQSSLRKSYGILHAHSIYHRLQRTFNTSLGYLGVFASKGHIKHYSIVHMARLRGSVRLRCSPKVSRTDEFLFFTPLFCTISQDSQFCPFFILIPSLSSTTFIYVVSISLLRYLNSY